MAAQLIARFEEGGLHWMRCDDAWIRANPDGSFDSIALSEFVRNGDKLVLAVPGEDVLLRHLSITATERRYLDDSLPYLLEEELAADVESLHFVHTAFDEDLVAVATAGCNLMRDYLGRCEELQLIPDELVTEPLLLPFKEDGITLLVEELRTIVRTGEADGFAIENEQLPAVLNLYCAQQEELPRTARVICRDEIFAQKLIGQSMVPDAVFEVGDFYSAVNAGPQGSPLLNMLQGQFKPMLPWGEWWRNWRMVAGLAALAIVLQLVGSLVQVSSLQEENLSLRQAMEASYRAVNPKGALQDAEIQLNNQLANLAGRGSGPPFVGILQQLGGVLSSQGGIELESLNFSDRNGDVRINLRAANYEAVDRLRGGLEQQGLEAVLQNSSAQGTGVRARLLIKG